MKYLSFLLFIILVVIAFTYNSTVGFTADYLVAVLVLSLKWFVGTYIGGIVLVFLALLLKEISEKV